MTMNALMYYQTQIFSGGCVKTKHGSVGYLEAIVSPYSFATFWPCVLLILVYNPRAQMGKIFL